MRRGRVEPSGPGLTSGVIYQGKQETPDLIYAKKGGTFTLVETMKVTGRSQADNFLLHTVFRMHIDENGVPSTGVDHFFVKCGGETVEAP